VGCALEACAGDVALRCCAAVDRKRGSNLCCHMGFLMGGRPRGACVAKGNRHMSLLPVPAVVGAQGCTGSSSCQQLPGVLASTENPSLKATVPPPASNTHVRPCLKPLRVARCRERAERRRLQRQLRKEERGAMHELRKDGAFMAGVRDREKAAKQAELDASARRVGAASWLLQGGGQGCLRAAGGPPVAHAGLGRRCVRLCEANACLQAGSAWSASGGCLL
jgi:hypothetical protein